MSIRFSNKIAFDFGFKFGWLIGLCLTVYLWYILGLGGPADWWLWIRYSVQVAIALSFAFFVAIGMGLFFMAANEFVTTVFWCPKTKHRQ